MFKPFRSARRGPVTFPVDPSSPPRTPHPGIREALDAAERARTVFRAWASAKNSSVIAAELTGPTGQIWELSVAPLSGEDGLHVIGNVYEEWSYEALDTHGPDLIAALRELQGIGRSQADIGRAISNRRLLGYGAPAILGGLRRTFALSSLGDIECVQRAYAPIAGHWDEQIGNWASISLEEACEREQVSGDLRTRTERQTHLTAALIHAVAAHEETP